MKKNPYFCPYRLYDGFHHRCKRQDNSRVKCDADIRNCEWIQNNTSKTEYLCGDYLPVKCPKCGVILTDHNIDLNDCGCDVCEYCGTHKCYKCGNHLHCGDCV